MQTSSDILGKVAAIDRSTLAEEIYRRLRRAILAGELAAEERVQPDRLASVIGVSRTPVREALQRLLAEGYLEQEARHAFRVAPVDYQSGKELFVVRSELEGLAAAQAVGKLDAETRENIQATIEAISSDANTEWPEKAVGDFHRLLYNATGNRHLIQILDRVFDLSLRYRFLTRSDTVARQEETLQDHKEILTAVLDGRGEDADRLMREHVQKLGRRFEETQTSGN